MALDLSNLGPADIATTMRSLPRRFREALEVDDDEEIDQLVRVVGDDGRSALDHVAETGRLLALFENALGQIAGGRAPVVPPALTDPSARQWDQPATDLDGELGLLDDHAEALADRVGRVPADRWSATGQVTGGGEITALDLAKEAVQVAIGELRATEAAMAHARAH